MTHERLDELKKNDMVGEQMTNHLLIDIHHAITHLTSRVDKLNSTLEKIERRYEGKVPQ